MEMKLFFGFFVESYYNAEVIGVKLLISPNVYWNEISFQILSGAYYYAEGIKLLITPNVIRGKEARLYHNSNGVELCEAVEYTNQNPRTLFNLAYIDTKTKTKAQYLPTHYLPRCYSIVPER